MMKFEEIRKIAIKIHEDAGTTYGNGLSYSVHLDMVHSFFVKYKKYIKKYADDVEKALFFHDVKEDCGKTLDYIANIIGQKSAIIVGNVSNEDGANRKEKLINTLPKIASTYESIFLKLCDRLANVTFSVEEKKKTLTSNMCNVYINEYPVFRYFLKKNGWFDEMWDELDALVGFEDSSHIAIIKNDINTLVKTRLGYIEIYNNNSEGMPEPPEIDTLGDKIRSYVHDNMEILPVDFIIESLTHLGQAPNILYDDNGFFAVTGDGFQSVSTTEYPIGMDMSFSVPANFWKPSIREALIYYLNYKEE